MSNVVYGYKNNKTTFVLFVFLCLSFLKFFYPNFLPASSVFWKFVNYALILVFGIHVYRLKTDGKSYCKGRVFYFMLVVFICQIISVLNAYLYEYQPFGVSLIAFLQYCGFIVFFFLTRSRLTVKSIEKVIIILAVSYVICDILNRLSGTTLFGRSELDIERGGIRYRLVGIHWVILAVLLNINRYITNKKSKYLVYSFLFYICIILSFTRQIIFVTFLLSFIMIMHKAKMYQKFIVSFVIVFSFIVLLPKITILNNLIDLTESQVDTRDENIRLFAFNYYAFEYPRNRAQKLFGVGVPSFDKSNYGDKIQEAEDLLKLYRSDVGYAGYYFDYGIISLICLILAIISCSFKKVKENVLYTQYFLLGCLILAIASTPFTSATVQISICMYVLTLQVVEKNIKKNCVAQL